MAMKRVYVSVGEELYARILEEARARGTSVSALIREILSENLCARASSRPRQRFSFIGAGESRQGDLAPVSERHDEALSSIGL